MIDIGKTNKNLKQIKNEMLFFHLSDSGLELLKYISKRTTKQKVQWLIRLIQQW